MHAFRFSFYQVPKELPSVFLVGRTRGNEPLQPLLVHRICISSFPEYSRLSFSLQHLGTRIYFRFYRREACSQVHRPVWFPRGPWARPSAGHTHPRQQLRGVGAKSQGYQVLGPDRSVGLPLGAQRSSDTPTPSPRRVSLNSHTSRTHTGLPEQPLFRRRGVIGMCLLRSHRPHCPIRFHSQNASSETKLTRQKVTAQSCEPRS